MLKKCRANFRENTRMVVGMCLSAISVIMAGLLESERLYIIQSDPTTNTIAQIIDNTTYYAADLNILWQTPQYTLIGLGEVFCSVASLYFAYSAAPKSMQGIIMGLSYFFSGIGSFFGLFTLWSFKSYIFSSPDNIDDINCTKCHLNYYFYYLSLIQLLGVILFILIDYKYKIAASKNEIDEYDSSEQATTSRSLFRQDSERLRVEAANSNGLAYDINQNNGQDLIENTVNA